MQTVETTAQTGADGVLRLEVPTGRPNQTMQVVVIAQALGEDAQQARLPQAGIRPPVGWNAHEPQRLELGEPPVSQTLVEDRR